mgnify:CR=1 FL=1
MKLSVGNNSVLMNAKKCSSHRLLHLQLRTTDAVLINRTLSQAFVTSYHPGFPVTSSPVPRSLPSRCPQPETLADLPASLRAPYFVPSQQPSRWRDKIPRPDRQGQDIIRDAKVISSMKSRFWNGTCWIVYRAGIVAYGMPMGTKTLWIRADPWMIYHSAGQVMRKQGGHVPLLYRKEQCRHVIRPIVQ